MLLLGLLCVGMVGAGLALVISDRGERDTRARYGSLPRCPDDGLTGDSCWGSRRGTLVDAGQAVTALGGRRDHLDVAGGGTTVRVEVEPVDAFRCATAGDPVAIKGWRGVVTGVFTPHGFVPTSANPNVRRGDRIEAGILLVSVGLIVPVAAVVAGARSRRGRPPRRLSQMAAWRDVRLALVLFGVGQVADVVSSAVGQRAGLLEGNPLVADVVALVGPLGFLVYRLPLIVLFLLAAAQLPRLLLVGMLLGCAVYFSVVGGENLHLAFAALAADPRSGCGPGSPLPI